MPTEEDMHLNGIGRAQSIYQQQSTGEKHVLFYPTSPAPSLNSEERRSWSQASSSNPQARNNHHKNTNNNTENVPRMNKTAAAGATGTAAAGETMASTDPADSGSEGFPDKYNFRIGIYGWRKRCLYILILVLLVMVIVNLALTLWVLKVMEFSADGMGQLKIVSGGLRLEGKSFVLDSLIASSIRSRTGQAIVIESSNNLTLSTRTKSGLRNNVIFLGNDNFECLANNFKILDGRGVLFSVDNREVVLGSENLRVTGEGGTSFSGSVQTTLVRAESGNNLRLESVTRSLDLQGAEGVHIESNGGHVKISSLNDISFKTGKGAVKLESSSVFLPTIPTATPASLHSPESHNIFQLCACNNGKLFLASPHSICASEEDDRICR